MRTADIPIGLLALSLIGLLVCGVDLLIPTVPLRDAAYRDKPGSPIYTVSKTEFVAIAQEIVQETDRISLGLGGVFVLQLTAVLWLIWLSKKSADADAEQGWTPKKRAVPPNQTQVDAKGATD